MHVDGFVVHERSRIDRRADTLADPDRQRQRERPDTADTDREPQGYVVAAEEALRQRAAVVEAEKRLVDAGGDDRDDRHVVRTREPQVAPPVAEVDLVTLPEGP